MSEEAYIALTNLLHNPIFLEVIERSDNKIKELEMKIQESFDPNVITCCIKIIEGIRFITKDIQIIEESLKENISLSQST